MKDKYFIDTNILVYSFDNRNKFKREKAEQIIIQAISSHDGIISFQVVQEFLNVAMRKFSHPLTIADARQYFDDILSPLCEVFPSVRFYSEALDIHERTGYSFYDSMIMQAAREGGCRILYSEDFQNGFKMYDVTIVNPFAE